MYDEFEVTQDELARPQSPRKGGQQPGWWRRHWKKVVLIVLGLGALVAGAILAFLFFNVAKISVNPFGYGKLKGESEDRINIMMLGVGDPGHDGESLSDTNLLLSIKPSTHQIAIISIPRDTQVTIPGYGQSKINNANAQGGIDGAKEVFENTLGVPVNYYVQANFTGLKQVVDAVGGVDVTNTALLSDPEYPCDANQYRSCGYKLAPGKYHLNGTEALKYVRCRKGTCGDDFGRAARQQEVMEQIKLRATSLGTLGNPIKLAKLVTAAGSNIKTDLSINNMMRLVELTKESDASKISNIVFSLDPGGFLVQSTSSSNLLPEDGDFSAIQDFVKNVFALGPIWTEHPNIDIQNGTTTVGLATKLKGKIDTDGQFINILALANALTQDHTTTVIIDASGGTKPHTISYLEGILGVKATRLPADQAKPASGADIQVILGSDYAAKVAPSSSTPAQ